MAPPSLNVKGLAPFFITRKRNIINCGQDVHRNRLGDKFC